MVALWTKPWKIVNLLLKHYKPRKAINSLWHRWVKTLFGRLSSGWKIGRGPIWQCFLGYGFKKIAFICTEMRVKAIKYKIKVIETLNKLKTCFIDYFFSFHYVVHQILQRWPLCLFPYRVHQSNIAVWSDKTYWVA